MSDSTSKPRVLLSILKGESFEHLPDAETLFTAISAGYGRFECERLLKPSGVELMNLPASASIEICVLQRDRETGQKHLRYHGLVPLASVHPAFFNPTGSTGVPPAPGAGGEGGSGTAARDSPSTWESWLGLFSADVDLKKAQSPDRVFQQCLEMGTSRAGFPRLFLRLQYLPPGASAVQQRTASVRGTSRSGDTHMRRGESGETDTSPMGAPIAQLAGGTPTSRISPPDPFNLAAQAQSAFTSVTGAEEAVAHAASMGTGSRLTQWQVPGSDAGQATSGMSPAGGYPTGRGPGGNVETSSYIPSATFNSSRLPSKEKLGQLLPGQRTPSMGIGIHTNRSPSRYDAGVHQLPPTGDVASNWLHGRLPGPSRGMSPAGGKSPYRSTHSPGPSAQPRAFERQTSSPNPLPRFQSGAIQQADDETGQAAAELVELRKKNEELALALKDARGLMRASETYELRQLVAELRAQAGELERENLRLHERDLARESIERDFFEQAAPALTNLGFQQRATPAEMAKSTDVARGHFAQIATALADALSRKQAARSEEAGTSGGDMFADLAEEAIARAVEGGEPAFEEWFKNNKSNEKLAGAERLVNSCRQAATLKSALGKEPSALLGSFFYAPVKNDPVDLLIAARFLRLAAEPTVATAAAGLTRLDTGKYSLGPHGPTFSCHIDQGHVMVQPPNAGEPGDQAAVELGAFLAARGG